MTPDPHFSAQSPEPSALVDASLSSWVPDASSEVHFPPGPNHEERLADIVQAQAEGRNALLLAARELLRALAELPSELQAQQVRAWRDLLATELQVFTRLCEQANLRRDHMLAVRYMLCTALDEAASLAPWNVATAHESAGLWSSMALLPEFHGESQGGEVVFLLIGRLANAATEHIDVLEVAHHVLSLGFMGDYRVQAEGHRLLETIRHRLYGLVLAQRGAVPRELSSQWQGVGRGKFQLLRSVPVWASASVLGLVLLGQFGWAKYQLLTTSADVEKRIEALHALQPSAKAVQPVAATPLRLAELLSAEVAQGRLVVTDGPGRSLVVFKGDGMFAGGLAQLSPTARQTLQRVAQALNDVPGQVVITGHTDNQPLTNAHGPAADNQALSLLRAQEVAAVLSQRGVDPHRIQTAGRGDSEPVAPNDTATGRALNRRVQIEVRTTAQP